MTEKKLSIATGAAAAVVLAALLVASTIAPVGAVGSNDTEDVAQSDAPDPADEIYVEDDGDAVLVYEDEMDDDEQLDELQLGANVGEGLFHVLFAGEAEDLDENSSGNLMLLLEQDRFLGEGDLQTERPEDLESLSLDVSAEQTSETNEFDATLDATLAGDEDAAGVGTLETTGDVTTTPDVFKTSGDFTSEAASDDEMAALGSDYSYDVSIQSVENGYDVEVEQDSVVWSEVGWESADQAEQTLQQQYGAAAEELGGSGDVTVHEHDLSETDDGQYRLDVSYTIEYRNVEDGLASGLGMVLATDEQLDLNQTEAQELAGKITDVDIRTVDVSVQKEGTSTTGEWEVEIGNYRGVIEAFLDIAEAMDEEAMDDEQLEEARQSLDAQQAADLEQSYEWSLSIEETDDDGAQVSAELTGDTENWDDYVSELEDRGIEGALGDVTFDMTAETDGDELTADVEMELEQDELVETMLDSMSEQAVNDPRTTGETEEFVSKLEQSEFEVGKIDASVDGQTVQVEAGAEFGNVSALADEFGDVYEGQQVTEVVAEAGDDGNVSAHVHLSGAVDEDATEDDVRALAVVDEDTQVHMPGDWDREFDGMDTEEARAFLQEDGSDDDGLMPNPGFGPGVAVLSLLGAALLAQRRR